VSRLRGGSLLLRSGLLLLLVAATVCMAAFANQLSLRYAFVISSFVAGGLVFALGRIGGFSLRFVLTLAVVLRLLVAWLPPTLSDDAYRYIWDGRLQVEGINPYNYVPSDPALDSHGDPDLLSRLNSPEFYSVYPPVSQFIFALGALAGGEDWLSTFYTIKLLLIATELAGLFLLARLAEPRMLILYAWNPLVIMETAGQAHTESAVILFLVACLWFAWRGSGHWAGVALALAGWVKLYPFVLFPFLWRRFGWSAVWPGVIAAILVAAPYASPVALPHVAESLDLYVRYFEFNAGPYYALKESWRFLTGVDVSKTLGPAFRLIFLALLPFLYVLDARLKWPLERAFTWALGAFFLLATTVHPWYILGLLAIATVASRPSWHWLWLGLCSMGTYLFYGGGPYWSFVIAGWGGWLVLVVLFRQDEWLQILQRFRASQKYRRISPYLPESSNQIRVLDLGAGEGYLGEHIRDRTGAEVWLADVLPMNRTQLPSTLYDGRKLPFADDAFDVVVLYFVLHHCEDQHAVLREAVRTCRGRVIIVESVYETSRDLRVLTFLDTLANRWRSGGRMRSQEEHLLFRTDAEWRRIFRDMRISLRKHATWGRFVHKQVLYVLEKSSVIDE